MKRTFSEFIKLFSFDKKMFLEAMTYVARNLFGGKNRKTRLRDMYTGKTLPLRIGDIAIIIDGKDFGLAREIYINRVYFQFPGFDVKKDDIVFDAGSNVGIFTLYAAKFAKHVYSVEANRAFIEEMLVNLERNGCADKVTPVNALIGHEKGRYSDKRALSAAIRAGAEPELTSINSIMNRHKIDRINFMKVDIEGSEFDIFFKNNGWLKNVDRIAMEVHPAYGNPVSLGNMLASSGFRVWYVDQRKCKRVRQLSVLGYIFAENTRLPAAAAKSPSVSSQYFII